MGMEAKAHFLSVIFRGKPAGTRLFVGLSAELRTIPETLTEAAVREPTAREGYSRQVLLNADWSFRGDDVLVSKAVIFRNGGRELWSPIYASFLATTEDNSGVLLAWAPLDRPRSLISGDELVLPITIRF